ncbi:hypothetical protein MMC31_008195 [Peltigera leucophlebia]|nr:hypothetical protein [Peltigera leucophlebia]
MARQRKLDVRRNGRQFLIRKNPKGITKKPTAHLRQANPTALRHPFCSLSTSHSERSLPIKKSEQNNPYTSSLQGNSQCNKTKSRPELSVSEKDLHPDLQEAEIPLPQTPADPPQKQSSPSTSNSHEQLPGKERKRAVFESQNLEETNKRYPKRRKVLRQTPKQPDTDTYDPVAHWTRTLYWPKDLAQRGLGMSEPPFSGKKRSTSSSSSFHRSQVLERMSVQGVFMAASTLISKTSEELCERFLEGNHMATESSIFTGQQFSKVLERVQNLNEARIQRDVTPWVVPSAETLFLRGKLKIDYIGEELNAEWIRCATMGSTRPKPDFTGGLLLTAFTEEEISKLENYAQPTKPFRFTPNLSFPFLVCEVKTGEEGLNKADRQNIHSASIAVRAIIVLYGEAFGHRSDRVQQLYGEVLVFSVSHDNDRILIYGHFAVAAPDLPDGLKYYRYPIVIISFTTRGGADMHKAYNFIMNVYEDFAPVHLERIKAAVRQLPRPSEKTDLLIANESDSQQNSQEMLQGDSAFRKPSEPASKSQRKEIAMITELMEKQKRESEREIERQRRENFELKEQLKQDREQSKQEREKEMAMIRELMEQQNGKSKQDIERQRREIFELKEQLKQDKEQSKQEREKEMAMIRKLMEQQSRESRQDITGSKASRTRGKASRKRSKASRTGSI